MRVLLVLAMLVGSATAAPKKNVPGAVVLLIDRSGSMQGPKLEASKEAARVVVKAAEPDDQVSVIAFDTEVNVMFPLQRPGNRKKLLATIDRLQSGGGTTVIPAIRAAIDALKPSKLKKKHVILFTDGESPDDGLDELLDEAHKAGITISTLGVGDADRNLLAKIADACDGRLYMVEDVAAIPKLFLRELNAGFGR